MFGKESAGIPEELLAPHPEMCVRIPMAEGERSLNLAASCAIALYEAERQLGYKDLVRTGEAAQTAFFIRDSLRRLHKKAGDCSPAVFSEW